MASPSTPRVLSRWHSSVYVSEGQAAVELFFRLNHARQTMAYVRHQVVSRPKLLPHAALRQLPVLLRARGLLMRAWDRCGSRSLAACAVQCHLWELIWSHHSKLGG